MNRTFGVSVVALLALAGTAHAQFASAIFAESGALAAAPGLGGLNFIGFDRPYRSLNGNWIITATVNTGVTSTDEVVYTGVGTTGTFRVQEGVTAIQSGRTIDSASIDTKVSINDAGSFALTGNLSGTTTDDESIIAGTSGGVLSVAYQEGQSIGTPATFTGPVALGVTLDSPGVSNSGAISFRAFGVTGGGAGTGNNTVGFRNNVSSTDLRLGTTAPSNLAARTYDGVFSGDYWSDAVGANWFAVASVNGATADDGVVVLNNAVVIQEGVTAFGTGTALTFSENAMDPSGRWFVRGSNSAATGGQDWIAYGDTTGAYSTVALTDQPIVPSSTENWTDDAGFTATFFLFAGDNNGNYVVGGVTDAADTSANAVLIYNGLTEVLREGDAVDLNGDGLLNDGAFVSVFNNDDAFLSGDSLYFTADLKDASGASLGQAFMVLQVPAPGALALLGFAALAARRRR